MTEGWGGSVWAGYNVVKAFRGVSNKIYFHIEERFIEKVCFVLSFLI